MKEFEFTVYGRPKGKGRPRFTRKGHAYTPKGTKTYETEIKQAFNNAGGESFGNVPVSIEVTALYPIPKSARKADKEQMEKGMMLPLGKPDIDNVLKSVMDALNGMAFDNDAQVVFVKALKRYDLIGAAGAVEIRIRDMSS